MNLSPESQRLTDREREVVRLASLGYANKHIAFDLGVRESTVATWLGRGLRKLGGEHRKRAITVVSETSLEAFVAQGLTSTELEVLQMLIEGASNAEIAARRGRSVKTIANQVRAVYQRVGVGSRRELWAFSTRRMSA